MNRSLLNLTIDAVAALLFLGMLTTGYVLRFPLPPGTNKSMMLWGLTRHEWGGVHFWIGLGMLSIVLGHLVMHWQWVVSVIGRRLHLTGANPKRLLLPGAVTLLVTVGGFSLFAAAANRGVTGLNGPWPGVCPPEGSPGGEPADRGGVAREEDRGRAPRFWRDVYPVLERSCLSCHGPVKARAGFRIDRREDYFGKGGEKPLVVPGRSEESPLVEIVSGGRADMPLASRHRLPPKDVELLRSWIDAGAEWPSRK